MSCANEPYETPADHSSAERRCIGLHVKRTTPSLANLVQQARRLLDNAQVAAEQHASILNELLLSSTTWTPPSSVPTHTGGAPPVVTRPGAAKDDELEQQRRRNGKPRPSATAAEWAEVWLDSREDALKAKTVYGCRNHMKQHIVSCLSMTPPRSRTCLVPIPRQWSTLSRTTSPACAGSGSPKACRSPRRLRSSRICRDAGPTPSRPGRLIETTGSSGIEARTSAQCLGLRDDPPDGGHSTPRRNGHHGMDADQPRHEAPARHGSSASRLSNRDRRALQPSRTDAAHRPCGSDLRSRSPTPRPADRSSPASTTEGRSPAGAASTYPRLPSSRSRIRPLVSRQSGCSGSTEPD